MKRILLAFDGEHFSRSVFEFAIQMNTDGPIHVVGCFLPSVDYAQLLYSFGGVPSVPMYITEAIPGNEVIVKKNIAEFKAQCIQHNLAYTVLTDDTKHIITMIKEETGFADLLIINGRSFYANIGPEVQEEYVTNVLHRSECPVLVIPDEYNVVKSIVLAYDGSEQSVFAIKQFFTLFYYRSDIKVLLVFFGSKDESIPDRDKIVELLNCYHPNYVITKLDFHRQKEIEEWLATNDHPIVVTGAHGRTGFSELFHKSFVSTFTRNKKIKLFVAHR